MQPSLNFWTEVSQSLKSGESKKPLLVEIGGKSYKWQTKEGTIPTKLLASAAERYAAGQIVTDNDRVKAA